MPLEARGDRLKPATVFYFSRAQSLIVEQKRPVGCSFVGAVYGDAPLANLAVDKLDGGERVDASSEHDEAVVAGLEAFDEGQGAVAKMPVCRGVQRSPGAGVHHCHVLKIKVVSRVAVEQIASKAGRTKITGELANPELAGLVARAVKAELGVCLGREWGGLGLIKMINSAKGNEVEGALVDRMLRPAW